MGRDIDFCFVIMGFGKKTDYPSGRTLDLNATFESIIEPAVTASGLKCVRADQISDSGIIDVSMYDMLYRADLVIADISTGNANALYELGVRHALRPYSTIVMKEEEGSFYFDLNHIRTFTYNHGGNDIWSREAKRASSDLEKLIRSVVDNKKIDSPVYTFLPNLKKPGIAEDKISAAIDEAQAAQHELSEVMNAGEQALNESRFDDAVSAFTKARELRQNEPYIVQRLSLSMYKSTSGTKIDNLLNSKKLIDTLRPDDSTDPETLGISGSINKRIFLEANFVDSLNRSIEHYGRGYFIRRDYYNGENLALCLNYRSKIQSNKEESLFDRMAAEKIRRSLASSLEVIIKSPDFQHRNDKHWIFATAANVLLGLGLTDDAELYERYFYLENPRPWEIETYSTSKSEIIKLTSKKET